MLRNSRNHRQDACRYREMAMYQSASVQARG